MEGENPYPNEHACRINPPEKYERIRRVNNKGKVPDMIFGIKGGKTEVQAFRFPIDRFTVEEAREFCRKRGGTFEEATYGKAADKNVIFERTSVENLSFKGTATGTFLVEVISDQPNANNWQVTPDAIKKRFKDLVGVEVLSLDGHEKGKPIGKFVNSWLKRDSRVIGEFKPNSDEIASLIEKGQWIKVSPRIYALNMRREGPIDVIDDFMWDHVAFVENPAYPDIGVIAYSGEEAKVKLAPLDTPWDFRAKDYTIEQLRRACAWYDEENPDIKASYKLPHHLPDGTVVWRGVAAAMAVLMGARGGVDIPKKDRREVYEHLARHYRQFNKEPPEFKGGEPMGEDGKNLEDTVAALTEENSELRAKVKELEKSKADLESELKKAKEENEKMKANNEKLQKTIDEHKAEKIKTIKDEIISKDKDIETRIGKRLDDMNMEQLVLVHKALHAKGKPESSEVGEEGEQKEGRGFTVGFKIGDKWET